MKQIAAAEHKASDPARLTLQLTDPPKRYHYEWLSLAHTLLKLSNLYVINPRNLNATSLFEADEDWLADFGAYLQNLDFYRDYAKRPDNMK